MSSGPKFRPDRGVRDSENEVISLDEHRNKSRPQGPASETPILGGGGDDPPPPRGPSNPERKFIVRLRNEKVKLIASALSSLGTGLISIGFLQPLLKDAALLIREPHWGWVGIGLALHVFSHFIIHTEFQRED